MICEPTKCGDCKWYSEVEPIRTGEQPTTLGICNIRIVPCYAETEACKFFQTEEKE